MQFKGNYSGILVILGVCLCEERVEETFQMRFLHSVGLHSGTAQRSPELNLSMIFPTIPQCLNNKHHAYFFNVFNAHVSDTVTLISSLTKHSKQKCLSTTLLYLN